MPRCVVALIRKYLMSPIHLMPLNLVHHALDIFLQSRTAKGRQFFKSINATPEICLVASKYENIIYKIICE